MKSVVTLLGILTLMFVGTAVAQDDGMEFSSGEAVVVTEQVSAFESSDRDADGKISFEEYRNRMTKIFFDLDANQDGALSEDELSEILIAHREAADLDRDGLVSHREFAGHTALIFAHADSDSDGHLAAGEAQAAMDEEVSQ